MRTILSLLLVVAVFGGIIYAGASKNTPRICDNLIWGPTNAGIQMSLSTLGDSGSKLQLAFRNVGDQDVTLNLGSMLANGKVQLPDRITINLTDARGVTRQFKFADPRHGFVAGRLDDYVVPLRVGSTYTITLAVSQFWCQATKEFGMRLLPGKNHLVASFEGTGAQLVNLDMPGMKVMNFWLGKAESNTLEVAR